MKTAYYKTDLGTIKIEYVGEILYSLKLCGDKAINNSKNEFSDMVFKQIQEYLHGERQKFEINYKLSGTPFQIRVWNALASIPYGQTLTYKEVAIRINQPNSARAVGGACNKNPLWLIVPCHRVIGASGRLTGYAGGVQIKKKLLDLEKQYI